MAFPWPWKKKATPAAEPLFPPFVQSQVVAIDPAGKSVTLLTQAQYGGDTAEFVREWIIGDGPAVEIHEKGPLTFGQYQCPWQTAMACFRRRLFVSQN